MWAVVKGEGDYEIIHSPRGFVDANGRTHPPDVLTRWTIGELLEISVYPVERVLVPQPLHNIVGESYQLLEDKLIIEDAWEPLPLDDAKEKVRARVNQWKQVKQDGNFVYNESEFQCDERSRGFIMGRALDAFIALSLGQEYSIVFRDAANVDHTLTAEQMIELGKAAAAHVQHYHDEATMLKSTIDAATSVSDLLPIWESLES